MEGPKIPDPNNIEVNEDSNTSFVNEEPDEILEWMAEQGLKDQKFSVSIRKYPLGGGSEGKYMPYMEKDKAPNMFDIGKMYGPGKYVVGFAFHLPASEPGGRPKLTRKDHAIILGEEFQEIHDEYMLEMWATKEKNAEMIGQRMKVKRAYTGGGGNGNQGASEMDNLMKAMQNLKALGVPIGGGNAPATTDNNMFQLLISNMQASSENMMKIMMGNQSNMMTLLTAVMSGNNNRQQHPEAMFKEVSNLIMGAMNLKDTLTPEKRGALDKIIDMMGEVVPTIIQIHQQKGLEAAKEDPTVKMAKAMPQFQDIANNTVNLEYMIKTMDAKQGPDQTDILLSTLGLKRTSNTMRGNSATEGTVPTPSDTPDVEDIEDAEFGEGTADLE